MASSSIQSSRPKPDLHFGSGVKNKTRLAIVEGAFKKIIEPIYGDQAIAIEKMREETDRKCRLLFDDQTAVGMVVYKTKPTSEYGLINSLEIKTLCVLNPDTESRKGYGSKMLQKVEDAARDVFADSVRVTVNAKKTEVQQFFAKKGFTVHRELVNYPKKGDKEVVMVKQLNSSSSSNPVSTPAPIKFHPKQEADSNEHFVKRKVTFPDHGAKKQMVQQASASQSSQNANSGPAEKVPLKMQYLKLIQNGTKTIEGRINSGNFRNWKPGKKVSFFSNRESVDCTVTKIVAYKTFKQMLETEGYRKCIPDAWSLEEAVAIYANIPSFPEREARSGVLAIHIAKSN